MTESEIGSPTWDDVPQERPVWDEGSNESSSTGHRSRRISSSNLSQHSLERAQSPQAHLSQVELQISEMLPKLAEQIAMMRITNPEVLRVTPAFCAFEQCALALRGECEHDLFFKSQISHKISTFWSHSWHGGQWKKIATLIFLYNGPVAVLCGWLFAILTVPLFHYGLLPGLDRGWDDGKLFSCWALWSGLLVTICVIIFWRPRSYVFLDRICISQKDNELKAQAIFSLAGLLKSSDSMLILWDPTWTERLWCLFELAAFLKSNPDRKKQLIIRPILLGPVSTAVFVTVAAAMIPITMVPVASHPTTVFLPVAGALLGGLVVAYATVSTLRNYFRDLDTMKCQLSSISFDSTKSSCCDRQHVSDSGEFLICDRKVVQKCVDIWFGSQTVFENTVRSEVMNILMRDLSERVFTTTWVLAVTIPIVWAFMDLAITFAHDIHNVDWYQKPTLWIFAEGLAIWLLAVPSFKDLAILACRLTRSRPKTNCLEIAKNLAVLFTLAGSIVILMISFAMTRFINTDNLLRSLSFIGLVLLYSLCSSILARGIKALFRHGW